MSGSYDPRDAYRARRPERSPGRSSDRGRDYDRDYDDYDDYDDFGREGYADHGRGGRGADAYGRPAGAARGRPGEPGAPVWGQPGAMSRDMDWPGGGMGRPQQRRKSRRGLWITLGTIAAVLVVACGAGGVTFADYLAPAAGAGLFCGYLKTGNYAQAYTMLSAGQRAQFTSAQFVAAGAELDKAEGKVADCKAATGSGSYNHRPFGSAATATLILTRATSGALQGTVHLKSESGGWRVDGIDVGLLGASLGAIVAADDYCAALQGQQYDAAYALLASAQQTATKKEDYAQTAGWRDTLDGKVTACDLAGIGAGATETAATLTLTLTRAKLGRQQAALALAPEGGAWRIGDMALTPAGTDLAALQTAGRFCADVAAAAYADMYTLVTKAYLAGATLAQITAAYDGTTTGIKYSDCSMDASTYKPQAAQASVAMKFTLTRKSDGHTTRIIRTLTFVKQGSDWKLNLMGPPKAA